MMALNQIDLKAGPVQDTMPLRISFVLQHQPVAGCLGETLRGRDLRFMQPLHGRAPIFGRDRWTRTSDLRIMSPAL